MKRMHKVLMFCLALFPLAVLMSSCDREPSAVGIVPKPVDLKVHAGHFRLDSAVRIVLQNAADTNSRMAVNYLNGKIKELLGSPLGIAEKKVRGPRIIVNVDSTLTFHPEGYEMKVARKRITINARTAQGAFYAFQTLLQLTPPSAGSPGIQKGMIRIPCVTVKDYPRFSYRGMHLDVCRHFFPVEFILKQLDVMAMYKLNTFHWHLTEDQGWRIEIKKYPLLTQIGSRRTEGEGFEYGGYYTQDDIRKVVKYAQERFIRVIPEIEMPGHALAALAAYPQLSCTGGPFKVRNFWGVEENVFCAGREETFGFITDVLTEVAALFPSEYIHIGGDECPKNRWKNCPRCQERIRQEGLKDEAELQSYFIKRVEKILLSLGKKMIGWDEILEGGLAPSATVMSWRGEEGGIDAAMQGHDVVMTPGDWVYLDHYQGSPKVEPVAIGGYTTLEESYNYDPLPEKLPADKHHFILGCQGNIWTEYMYTPEKVEYMAYPRIIALAEVNWSPKESRNFADFLSRMNNQFPRLDARGINYHIPLPEGPPEFVAFTDSVTLSFSSSRPVKMVYTTDGSDPSETSQEYTEPLTVRENTVLKIRSVLPSGQMSSVRTITSEKQTPAVALQVASRPGLRMKSTEGNFIRISDLENAKNWKEQIIQNLSVRFNREKPSAAVITGYIEVPETGVYYFSSDNDQVWIAGRLLVNNDGEVKRFSRHDSSIALEKGKHALKIVFLNNTIGGWPSAWNGLSLQWKKEGEQDYKPVGKEFLSY